jgi:indolepyruvate ferredoxin oxidoreductase
MMVFGAAWQKGLLPVSLEAIHRAIELNGAAVESNTRAFEYGRWAALDPAAAERVLRPTVQALPASLEERIDFRAEHLVAYQGRRLAKRYRARVDAIADSELKEAVARGYHKLLSYKDEYEVARLLRKTRARAEEEFGGELKLTYHLAPPFLSGQDANGRPKKRRFGQWIERFYPVLSAGRILRGTWLDPFGRSEERRMERALIRQYEADMDEVLPEVTSQTHAVAVALAELPLSIRGFGPIKAGNAAAAEKRREELISVFRAGGPRMDRAAE